MSTNKESSAAGTDNRPPMLIENDYESWKIRIERYICGKPLGKLIWRSIQNGPTSHPQITVTEGEGDAATQVMRDKRDEEFTEIENNKELADIQATNILSQGLPRHVFNILNQTRTGKEIWDNVELLMKGSGKSLQQQKEELFDEYERFRAIGNESIHDYFVHFELGKTLKKQEQSSSIVDPLAYLASTTHHHTPTQTTNPPPAKYGPLTSSTPQQVPQSSNDDYLRTSSNLRSHDTVHDSGSLLLRPFREETQEGHVSRQCKEKKRVKDSQYFKDKMLLMEAKEKGTILDAEVEAFLVDVECTAPYDQPLAITTTSCSSHAIRGKLKQAKLSQPTLYDGHALLNPTHTSVKVHDSEDSLVHAEVSRNKMSERLGTIKPINDAELNALYSHFIPQKELSREQVYWLPAEELATQKNPCRYPSGSGEFKPIKAMFTEQIILFYENVKQLVQKLDENIITEVTEYMRIFDELDTDLENDICSIVLASDIGVPPSLNCLCEELRSNYDREHSKVVELEAEILKKQQMLNESEKCCAFIEKNHVNLQVKFQKYKECLQNQRVSDNSNSTTSNAIFEINKLKDQLQGKDNTIRNLQTHINITRMLNVGSTVVRIQIDGYKAENVNLKRRYEELSKSNAYSHSTFTAKINALAVENAKLKTELSGKKSSGFTASEKPKVLASGMYTNSLKYVPPPKRANWVKPTPLPKKKTKPATESRKPMAKSHTRNHRILPNKSVNARRAADHNRKLNVFDHNQFVIRSLKIMEPNVESLELTSSVSSSSKVTMISRFPDCKLSDQKVGSKGISVSSSIVLTHLYIPLTASSLEEQQAYGTDQYFVLEDLKGFGADKTCREGSLLNLSDHRAKRYWCKEISNPFIVDSLPKETISQVNHDEMVTTRRNSDDDVPNFEAMITAAVANALPNLTAALRTQITNDIRNGAGPSGGGGGDAIPQ
ncbi:hypothetical protein Tco_0934128 [Tanacetum coccineum]